MFIREMPLSERPYTKMNQLGPDFLSNSELLSLIIKDSERKSGLTLANEVIQKADGFENLSNLSVPELTAIQGIGEKKANEIIAAIELGKRLVSKRSNPRTVIDCPEAAADYAMPRLRYENKEHFCVILLNAKNHVIKWETISIGSLTASVVHPREVMEAAVKNHADSMILVHNHPSGDPSPSREDIDITDRLIKAGKVMDIPIHDHIILGDDTFISLREKNVTNERW